MNQLSGAEAIVRMLQAHGVRHIFGLCGDTHVLTRDERSAAYVRLGETRE